MCAADFVDASEKRLVLLGCEPVVELPAQAGNQREAVWTFLLADVHALNEPVFQRIDVLDHTIQKHVP